MKTAISAPAKDKIIAHILLYKEKDGWIAHCLDFDLLADSANPQKALSKLAGVINTHISYLRKHDQMSQLYNPAPKKYWRMSERTLN